MVFVRVPVWVVPAGCVSRKVKSLSAAAMLSTILFTVTPKPVLLLALLVKVISALPEVRVKVKVALRPVPTRLAPVTPSSSKSPVMVSVTV